jgi:uncharacterized protein YutE (UPF0331/DUF86 family)
MVNGVILQRIQALEQVLRELRSLGPLQTQQLEDDWRIRRALERDLQVAVEIVIDTCQRLVALSGGAPVGTGADAVHACVELGVLSAVEPYRRMVQFRNFIVHRYDHVDIGVLADVLNHRMPDFERFRDEVLAYVSR